MGRVLIAYLKKNYVFVLIGVYIAIGIVLNLMGVAYIFPPCLYKTVTGKNCLSCGVTRGTLALLQCKFKEAWSFNPLVYVYVPLVIAYFTQDFYRFYKNQKK